MYKGNDLLRKPVVSFQTGETLERVQDILFDTEQNRVLALLIDNGGVFRPARVVPFSRIRGIGSHAIMVEDESAVVSAREDETVLRALREDRVVKGTKVMTEDGRNLGSINDVYFDERTGRIEGYEVSGGIFSDVYTGKSFLPAEQAIKIGRDVAFVPSSTAEAMEERVGGIKASAENLSKRMSTEGGGMGQEAGEFVTLEGMGDVPADEVVGRRAQVMVRMENGSIIVAPGQIVDNAAVRLARQEGKEEELKTAVGMVPSGQAAERVRSGFGETKERARAGVDSLRTEAETIWERMKERLSEIRDDATARAEERRIRAALGRPVTRVILDQQDNVILNTGELITHEAIEKAKGAHVLEILLTSVYTGKPELTAEEMRAPKPGSATLKDT